MNKTREKYVVGIDEAGRGPLAGPVSISAVLMTLDDYSKITRDIRSIKWLMKNGFPALKDSKKLSEEQREKWFEQILIWKKEGILDFSNTLISSKDIDEKGISVVIKYGITRLMKKFEHIATGDINVLLDGSLFAPEKYTNQKTIIKGDELEIIISLASIISKVKRDRKMVSLSSKYPLYEFETHKGYGTQKHLKLIKKNGLSKIHRKTFCTKVVSS